MIITHNGTILKHDGTILTKITEVPPQPPFANTYSLSFDGVDDYVNVGNISSLSNTTQFTVSTWFNTNDINDQTTLWGNGDSASQLWVASKFYDDLIIYGGTSLKYYRKNNIISINTWYNLIVVYDGSLVNSDRFKVYLNGELITGQVMTGTINTITPTFTTDVIIGKIGYVNASYFNGNIDETSFFNYSLSSENVTSIYNSGIPNDLNLLPLPPTNWYRNGDNGAWKSPQWLIPSNDNKDKVSNYSFEFDGIDDRIQLSSDFVASAEFTVSFWMKPTTVGSGNGKIYPIGTFPNNDNYVKLDQIGVVWLRLGASIVIFNESVHGGGSNNLVLDTWQHIAFIRDSSNIIRCYRNGVDFGYNVANPANGNTLTLNSFGRIITNTFGFEGGLDYISFWNSDETANIATIYNGGEPTTLPSGAVAHYKMGEEANFTSNWLVDNSTSPNRALKFDNTYITSPPWSGYQGLRASTTVISSDHITLSTWFNSTDSGNNQGEIFKTSLYGIRVYADRVYLSKASALYRYWNSSGLFNGSWHNIIIYIPNTTTWDLADAKIYVDGVDLGAGTGIGNGTGVSQITDIYGLFKTGGGGGGTMTAEISNWAYWLSDKRDDVSTIYNNGVPGDLSSLSPNVWWKLDSGTVTTDTQVDVIDSSGNNVTGTGPRNTAKTIPALVSSIVNSRPPYSKRSFEFDGIDDKVELGTQSLGITGAISVSAWVKIPTSNTGGGGTNIQEFVCEDRTSGTNRNWALNWRGGGLNRISGLIFDSGGTAVAATTNAIVPNDGNWHHVMFTYTGDTSTDGLKLFVDGIQRAQATSANGGLRSTTSVVPTIGGLSQTTTWMFEGNIDEVSIFDTDQSSNVSTIYNSGIPNDLTELSPLHWYRMGEDASFNGTNWTIPDQAGDNNGTSDGMLVDALVGEAPNYSGGGISNGMTIEDRVGNAPNSENNALSYNMEREDRVEDTP